MKDNVLFLNMFALYEPTDEAAERLANAVILGAELDPAERCISLELGCEAPIPGRLLAEICRDVQQVYGLKTLSIQPHFPPETLYRMEPEDLTELFVRENPMCKGSLAGAKWEWEGMSLTIKLRANGKAMIEKALPAVLRKLRELCGAEVEISIEAGADLQGKELFDAMEKIRAEMIAKGPKPVFADKKPAASGGGAAPQQQGDTFYGKPFKGNAVPMKDLSLDMGFVIVEGRVFAVEHKELKKRNAWVINFDMTDNTNSVRVSKFMEANEATPVLDNVSVGSVLRVQGKMDVNKFDNETILRPYGMMPGSMPKRKDTAEGLKRVELHLHTTMSNMDALTPTGAAVKQAAGWGHRAIGITDHGVTQSFPDAMKAAGKAKVAGTEQNIKILYGMEGYYVNDVDDRIVVHGSSEAGFDDEFVAFDLETTGLSSLTDTIIEIGAVVFKQGKEIERFQTFVDPGRKLEKKIIDLTGITDAMLVVAPKIEEVLPKFLDFVGGRPLVAHNADFDVGFVREAAKRLNLPFDPTSVDTLILSQNLLSHLNKFKLNIVADALSLPEFNHHRAADDSFVCGLIFDRLMPKLRELGVDSIQKINAAMPALRSRGKVNDRQARHIILYAKNQQGLRNLYHLISLGNLEYFKRVPRIPKSELLRYREGLIIGSACEAGELFQAIINHKSEDELLRIASFYDFLEIQPLDNNRFMLRKEMVSSEEELREFNRTVVRLGEKLQKPVCATGDVHFLNPEDEIFRHILLATKGFEDCDAPNPLYFRTTDEMLR